MARHRSSSPSDPCAAFPPDELRGAVDRLLEAGRRVIVQGPYRRRPEASPSLLRVGAVDHRALLPRAALAVHHGGAGTSHAVAAAGIPSVVVPHVGDQALLGGSAAAARRGTQADRA